MMMPPPSVPDPLRLSTYVVESVLLAFTVARNVTWTTRIGAVVSATVPQRESTRNWAGMRRPLAVITSVFVVRMRSNLSIGRS